MWQQMPVPLFRSVSRRIQERGSSFRPSPIIPSWQLEAKLTSQEHQIVDYTLWLLWPPHSTHDLLWRPFLRVICQIQSRVDQRTDKEGIIIGCLTSGTLHRLQFEWSPSKYDVHVYCFVHGFQENVTFPLNVKYHDTVCHTWICEVGSVYIYFIFSSFQPKRLTSTKCWGDRYPEKKIHPITFTAKRRFWSF